MSNVMRPSNIVPIVLIVAVLVAGDRRTPGVSADDPGPYASAADRQHTDGADSETDSSGELFTGRDSAPSPAAAAVYDGAMSDDAAAAVASESETTASNSTRGVSFFFLLIVTQ
jgi:hypothetical protein